MGSVGSCVEDVQIVAASIDVHLLLCGVAWVLDNCDGDGEGRDKTSGKSGFYYNEDF